MDSSCQNSELNAKYLLAQLNTARKEINNLRQQIKSLRYIHEKDVDNIKRLLDLHKSGISIPESGVISEEVKPSTSTENDILKLKPIGVISTWFPNKRGTPRQPGICAKTPGKVILHKSIFTNPDHALEGLQGFSHMWILFHFHRNDSTHIRAKVAPPRLNGMRTGVFATRSPHRPCPIGLSLVEIVRIENCTIYFKGVDMVDQSPVLDIKPYIPRYDNPLNIEELCSRPEESNQNDAHAANCVEDSTNSNRDHAYDTFENTTHSDIHYRNGFQQSEHRADVSRDEEIALRLQEEEFQGTPNFENLDGSRYFLQADVESASVHASSTEQGTLISTIQSRMDTLHTDEENDRDSLYTTRTSQSNYVDVHISRNSRLLDGADGPNTVCGTDLDFIHRRSLNSRIDNSPVRMGVREAPDGEEGFQSQALTPSQTLSNIQVERSVSNSNLSEETDIGTYSESRSAQNSGDDANFTEVRVPDWISTPHTTTLSVVFNERALMQLNEILEDKAEEQKYAIENVLREDPRSVYLRQRWGNQFYTFLIHDLHITCRFDDTRGIVTVFQVRHAGRTCECGEPEWQCLGHSPLS